MRGAFAGGLASGVLNGMSIAEYIRRGQMRQELAQVQEAKPETIQGFTAEDGEQLRAAAESGQYDVGYDDQKGAYTVTAKSDPSAVGVINQRRVSDFLGERVEGSMSPDQVSSARQVASAGVLRKFGEAEGAARLESHAKQSRREDQRFEWEGKRNEREEQRHSAEDARTSAIEAADAEAAEFLKGRLKNQDGTARTASVNDYVEANQVRAAKLYSAGQSDAANKVLAEANAQAMIKIKMEEAQRTQDLGKVVAAIGTGDYGPAGDFYMRYIPDGANLTAFKNNPDGSITVERKTDTGRVLEPHVFKSKDELVAAFNSFNNSDSLYQWSQSELRRNLAMGAEKRAQEAHAAGMQDRKDKRAAGEALYRERNPNATPAELDAVRTGVMPPSPGAAGYKLEMNEVATAFGVPATDAQGKPIMDLMTGRQVVNRDTAAEDKFFSWMKANGITDTNKGLLEYKALPPGGAGQAGLSFASEADAEAAAKAGKIKKGDRITIGGKSGTWQ